METTQRCENGAECEGCDGCTYARCAHCDRIAGAVNLSRLGFCVDCVHTTPESRAACNAALAADKEA